MASRACRRNDTARRNFFSIGLTLSLHNPPLPEPVAV